MAKGDVIFAFGGTFLVGVFIASIGNLWWLAIAATAIFLLSLRKWAGYIATFLAISSLAGFFYFFLFHNLTDPNLKSGEKTYARVIEEPNIYDKHQRFTAKNEYGRLEIITSPEETYRYGDELEIVPSRINERTLIFPEIIFIKSGDKTTKGRLIDFRKFAIGQYKKHLSHESAALMSGILLGYRSDFSKEFRDNMAKSGTTHIVALSGYNISVLIIGVSLLLLPLIGKRYTFIATTVFIVIFTIMVGAEASIVRAAIMGFLIVLARETGRLYSLRNAIVLAALAMVLWSPRVLAFDLGFQLSFLSLWGIIYLSPLFQKATDFITKKDFWSVKENLSNTLSAQLMVSPLILNTFGQISFFGVVANVLILSFVPLAMMLGFILFIVSLVWGGLAQIIGLFLEVILQYMIFVINLFAEFNFGLQTPANMWYALLYYLLLIAIMYNFKKYERS